MELTERIKQINNRIDELKTTKARIEGQQEQIVERVVELAEKLDIKVEEPNQELVDTLKTMLNTEQQKLQSQVIDASEKLDEIDRLLKEI